MENRTPMPHALHRTALLLAAAMLLAAACSDEPQRHEPDTAATDLGDLADDAPSPGDTGAADDTDAANDTADPSDALADDTDGRDPDTPATDMGCVPVSCAGAGIECGPLDDGCGATLDCGSCPWGGICGAEAAGLCADPACEGDTCDRFGRQLDAGLGTSSRGLPWWTQDDAAVHVDEGLGWLAPPAGSARHARLGFDPPRADYTVKVRMRLDDPQRQQAYVLARYQDDDPFADQYMAGFKDGAWILRKRARGTLWQSLVSYDGPVVEAGGFYHVALRVRGVEVSMRAWADGEPEPADWASIADPSIAAAGRVGLRAWSDQGADGLQVAFDDLEVFVEPPAPSDVLSLDMNFDSGSLDLANTVIDGDTVRLAGRDVYNPGKWKWLHFRVDGAAGRRLFFEIGDHFAAGSARLTNHRMVYSYDGQSWHFFDQNTLDTGAGKFTFSNDTPFTGASVFVAYGLPYPVRDALALLDLAAASPWVTPTASADAKFVIGRSAGGVDDLGRRIPPGELHGFRITDASATGAKRHVVLAGGVHSNETTGNHTLHGLVEFLLGSSAQAQALRREAVFYVYPMVNPDGRFAGYNRSTVESPGEDPNRQWSSADWANNTEIRLVAAALLADTGADIDYLLDFHSTVGTAAHYAYLDLDASPTGRDMSTDAFWQSLDGRDPLQGKDASFVGRTLMRYGWSQLGAGFAATVEPYFRPGEDIARYRGLGEAMGLAFHDALVP